MVTLLVALLIVIAIILILMYAAERAAEYIDELRKNYQGKNNEELEEIYDTVGGDPMVIADPRFSGKPPL